MEVEDFYCKDCDMWVKSQELMQIHKSGDIHKKRQRQGVIQRSENSCKDIIKRVEETPEYSEDEFSELERMDYCLEEMERVENLKDQLKFIHKTQEQFLSRMEKLPLVPQTRVAGKGSFWRGVLRWEEFWYDDYSGASSLTSYNLRLIVPKRGNDKIFLDHLTINNWPEKLPLKYFLCKKKIKSSGLTFGCFSVVFVPEKGRGLEVLNNRMKIKHCEETQMAGYIEFTCESDIKVLVLIYDTKIKAFKGMVPDDPKNFLESLHRKKSQIAYAESLTGSPGPSRFVSESKIQKSNHQKHEASLTPSILSRKRDSSTQGSIAPEPSSKSQRGAGHGVISSNVDRVSVSLTRESSARAPRGPPLPQLPSVGSSEIRRAWGMESSNRNNDDDQPAPGVPPGAAVSIGNSGFRNAWAELGIESKNRIPALPVSGSSVPSHPEKDVDKDTGTGTETFDRNYEKMEKIGRGAFGKAYKVKSKTTGKVSVMKKIEIINLPSQEKEIEVQYNTCKKLCLIV